MIKTDKKIFDELKIIKISSELTEKERFLWYLNAANGPSIKYFRNIEKTLMLLNKLWCSLMICSILYKGTQCHKTKQKSFKIEILQASSSKLQPAYYITKV